MTAHVSKLNRTAFAALRIDVLLDAAILLVVSVCAVLVRIIGLSA